MISTPDPAYLWGGHALVDGPRLGLCGARGEEGLETQRHVRGTCEGLGVTVQCDTVRG